MNVSLVELYKQTNTSSGFMLPRTSNLDGQYYGEGMVNMILSFLLSVYHESELKEQLEFIKEDESNNGWVPVLNVYNYVNRNKDDDMDSTEFSILKSNQRGYIEITIWDGVRYFKPTEKCLDLKLYKYPEDL